MVAPLSSPSPLALLHCRPRTAGETKTPRGRFQKLPPRTPLLPPGTTVLHPRYPSDHILSHNLQRPPYCKHKHLPQHGRQSRLTAGTMRQSLSPTQGEA